MSDAIVHMLPRTGPFATLCGPAKGRSFSIVSTVEAELVTCPICRRLMSSRSFSPPGGETDDCG